MMLMSPRNGRSLDKVAIDGAFLKTALLELPPTIIRGDPKGICEAKHEDEAP